MKDRSKLPPRYVVRALRNVTREHNERHPNARVILPEVLYCYNTGAGESFERFAQVKGWLELKAGKQERKLAPGQVYRRAGMKAGDKMQLEGYAALFNSVADLGTFKEMIAPGAFDNVLNDDVRLLLNHEGAPLARTINGTLKLEADEKGLRYQAELVDTQAGRDLYEMVKRGDITQSSFGFTIAEQDVQKDGLRVIRSVGSLLDVSPVTYPAYKDTLVYVS